MLVEAAMPTAMPAAQTSRWYRLDGSTRCYDGKKTCAASSLDNAAHIVTSFDV
jgi:hypothetical protein